MRRLRTLQALLTLTLWVAPASAQMGFVAAADQGAGGGSGSLPSAGDQGVGGGASFPSGVDQAGGGGSGSLPTAGDQGVFTGASLPIGAGQAGGGSGGLPSAGDQGLGGGISPPQSVGMLGQGGGPGVVPAPDGSLPAAAEELVASFQGPAALSAIGQKILAGQALTQGEFLTYLEALEQDPGNQAQVRAAAAATASEKMPARGWALLATRLHDTQYGSAGGTFNDRRINLGQVGFLRRLPEPVRPDVELFRNGSENLGWEGMDLFIAWVPRSEAGGQGPVGTQTQDGAGALVYHGSSLTPKRVVDAQGREVDIAHAYAGAAALVMRRGVSATLMSHVNTGWGDSWQVWSSRLQTVRGLWGDDAPAAPQHGDEDRSGPSLFGVDRGELSQAGADWKAAAAYKPEDQKLGNDLGNKVRRYLQKNRSATLSEAFRTAFGHEAPLAPAAE